MPPRRSAAPPSRGVRAVPPHMAGLEDEDDANFVTRFIRDEITSPEKLPGNLNLAAALALFLGGIWGVRTFGELMVPA